MQPKIEEGFEPINIKKEVDYEEFFEVTIRNRIFTESLDSGESFKLSDKFEEFWKETYGIQ